MQAQSAESRVLLYGVNSHDECGYCGGGPVVSYGVRVQKMATTHYQELMDRGWRRSGTYFYKPVMHKTCCPQYTIRLDCTEFQISKSQRGVLKAMARYLQHGSTKAEETAVQKRPKAAESKEEELPVERQHDIDVLQSSILTATRSYLQALQLTEPIDEQVVQRSKVIHDRHGLHGDYSSNIAMLLASHLKRAHQLDVSPPEVADAIASRLQLEAFETNSQRGFINLARRDKQQSGESKEEAHTTAAAGAGPSRSSHKRKLSQPLNDAATAEEAAPAEEKRGHVLTIETTPAVSTPERFELYSRYQQAVHEDEPEELTEAGFTRFLANSPLYDAATPQPTLTPTSRVRVLSDGQSLQVLPCDPDGNVDPASSETLLPAGSYHQLYRLDGKLIAIGVIDITASTLSSVYCIYDPDLRELALGKFCALMEIQWILRHVGRLPHMRYYYMGYYIHSCPKMRYKGEYRPSQLLCPTSFTWHPLADCIPIFERFQFSPLRPDLAEARARIPDDTGPRSSPPTSTQQSDSSGAGAENRESEAASKTSPLDAFAPDVLNKEQLVRSVRMDIGIGTLVTLDLLMPQSQTYLLPILSEWVAQCGPRLAQEITLVFTK